MAENFSHYSHEDTDDDAPAEHHVEHASPPPPAPESPARAQQEGTIFSRGHIAPDLSRPLFDFIRRQEQPAARAEAAEPPEPKLEPLPSVSAPEEPDVRTYQPPVSPEMTEAIHAAHEAAAEDDDDDEAEDEDHAGAASTPAPPAGHHAKQAPPAPAPTEEMHRPLNDQFEEIMRAEMGDDFAALTSGERLSEPAEAPEPVVSPGHEAETAEDEEPTAPAPLAPKPVAPPPRKPTPEPKAFIPEWPSPIIPEAPVAIAEDEEPAPAAEIPPAPVAAESPAFYYTEDAPDEPEEPLVPVAAGGGSVPPSTPVGRAFAMGSGSGGGGSGGSSRARTGGGFGMPPMPTLGAFNPGIGPGNFAPTMERRESHNALMFVAGFATGWIIKQHLAKKKFERAQREAGRQAEKQNDKINAMAMEQQALQRKLQRTEGEHQAAQAAQAAEVAALQTAQAAETAAAVQAARAEAEQAPQAPSTPDRQASPATRPPEVAPPATRTEQVPPAPAPELPTQRSSEQVAPLPHRAVETPLQHTGGEAIFTGGRQSVRESFASRPAATEAVPAQAMTSAEQAPQSARTVAEDLVAKAYELQAGQHIEHATGGGHNIIVDKHGHEVQNAIAYGEEFQFQKRQEQVRAGALGGGANDSNAAAAPVTQTAVSQPYGIIAGLESGQIDTVHGHGLPSGAPTPTARQRLLAGRKQNPIVATIASPWLWASAIVLLIAFLVAAFI